VEKNNIKLNRIPRGHTLDTTYVSSYLADLIEGDGCIYISKNLNTVGSITITFNSKDLPLAFLIQKELNIGNIYKIKGKNGYNFIISDLLGLTKITNKPPRLSGKIRLVVYGYGYGYGYGHTLLHISCLGFEEIIWSK
jgi:hypothetical protein